MRRQERRRAGAIKRNTAVRPQSDSRVWTGKRWSNGTITLHARLAHLLPDAANAASELPFSLLAKKRG